jgi:hypothetical protein
MHATRIAEIETFLSESINSRPMLLRAVEAAETQLAFAKSQLKTFDQAVSDLKQFRDGLIAQSLSAETRDNDSGNIPIPRWER